MQVTISVGGRFHAFYLAQQLLKRGYLKSLITSYPKCEVTKYGIPKGKVSSVLMKELMDKIWYRFPAFIKYFFNPQYFIHEVFDTCASHFYTTSDICVAFSGFGLHTIKKAKETGAITMIERGSAHMLWQAQILAEEHEKYGLKFQRAPAKFIEKTLQEYEEADYISIPSLFAKRTFLERGIAEEKLIHVPYGVYLDEFKQEPKEDTTFRIVYAGGMTLRKGVHYLLKAFSELNLPDSELLLVGGLGEEIKPFFKKYEGNYRWLGHIPQEELCKNYSQSSAFVLNSIEDGFGMVIVQAMACGLPVICTTNTGSEDIVSSGKEGFIIPIRDVEALKEKILYLYENPERCKEMGQLAKERVRKGFTWDDYGDRIIAKFHEVLKKK